jgi:flavin reductase (DIM6/NTAB) family NADH-FMN oxidoreductase RutF
VRTDFDPEACEPGQFYKLLTAVVVPRPIAWVSSTSAEGIDNLAPHSFFTVACVTPPIVQFTSVGRKDSLANIEATGEFVVNLTPEALFAQVNATATNFPSDISEFDAVGIEREPSLRVKPPRVAASPVALECRLHSCLRLGDSVVVFGQVVHAALHPDVLTGSLPDLEKLRPLSRLGGNDWGLTPATREISRIPYAKWPEGFNPAT